MMSPENSLLRDKCAGFPRCDGGEMNVRPATAALAIGSGHVGSLWNSNRLSFWTPNCHPVVEGCFAQSMWPRIHLGWDCRYYSRVDCRFASQFHPLRVRITKVSFAVTPATTTLSLNRGSGISDRPF